MRYFLCDELEARNVYVVEKDARFIFDYFFVSLILFRLGMMNQMLRY